MKKTAIICALFTLFGIIMGIVACAETYPTTFIVSKTDYTTDTLELQDFNGEIWIMYGIEDITEGDIIAAIMDDNNTPIIYDDVIVKIRYCGYIED